MREGNNASDQVVVGLPSATFFSVLLFHVPHNGDDDEVRMEKEEGRQDHGHCCCVISESLRTEKDARRRLCRWAVHKAKQRAADFAST